MPPIETALPGWLWNNRDHGCFSQTDTMLQSVNAVEYFPHSLFIKHVHFASVDT